MGTPRYARAPSPMLRRLLALNGMLAPLLHQLTVAGLRLDVHLREGDHVQVYCGLTSIVDVALVGDRLRLTAAAVYRDQACAAGLFRDWRLDDPAFAAKLQRYFAGVAVEARWTSHEGAVQAA